MTRTTRSHRSDDAPTGMPTRTRERAFFYSIPRANAAVKRKHSLRRGNEGNFIAAFRIIIPGEQISRGEGEGDGDGEEKEEEEKMEKEEEKLDKKR